jgi:ribosomal protein L11 methyltransferase
MYLWRKTAEPHWLKAHEEVLQTRARGALALISRPGRKRLQLEIPCESRSECRRFIHEFGGRIDKLPHDWLRRFARAQGSRPLRIGKRLIVLGSQRKRQTDSFPYSLIIPARAAFGTGAHPTTAMSLRPLEEVTRRTKPQTVVDLGTGSGILALAARRFGAYSVLAIDIDPTAISTAIANAHLNRIDNVDFHLGDLRQWKPVRSQRDESLRLADRIDIVTANLFSELLIQILPKLKRSSCLILSGVLRDHENEFARALRRNKIDIVKVRRRGKWIAVLAKGRDGPSSHPSN